MSKNNKPVISEHFDNERTFLSWIRTGIGIMVFGFVLVKFSLVVNDLPASFFNGTDIPKNGFTIFIGIALVITGAIMILLAYLKYRQVHRELIEGKFLYSTVLLTVLTVVIFIMSMIIIAYLIMAAYPMIFE
ncbi:YidH family protein [Flavobacterium sp. ARAG 55.4]|uniref:DUF202 domain-containing protein n=1 Tax=Flavobacterium plantiphilum TaxID=3163297 RepID=A0ABW8XWL3_9FLAO